MKYIFFLSPNCERKKNLLSPILFTLVERDFLNPSRPESKLLVANNNVSFVSNKKKSFDVLFIVVNLFICYVKLSGCIRGEGGEALLYSNVL